jgi:hypothetical protein
LTAALVAEILRSRRMSQIGKAIIEAISIDVIESLHL